MPAVASQSKQRYKKDSDETKNKLHIFRINFTLVIGFLQILENILSRVFGITLNEWKGM